MHSFLENLVRVHDFLVFVFIGFAAQLFDGALGMGFGIISYTVLSGMGMPHMLVSASVNGAKIFTGAASGIAHIRNGNINWRLFRSLALCGALGGVVGVVLLTWLPSTLIKPLVATYLIFVGFIVIVRAWRPLLPEPSPVRVALIGGAGGFLEATAGVWGPLVTSNLIAFGSKPRYVVGSGNLAETVVALTVSVLLAAHVGIGTFTVAVAGLLGGALLAAPVAAKLTRQLPPRTLMVGVGVLVITTSLYRLLQSFL